MKRTKFLIGFSICLMLILVQTAYGFSGAGTGVDKANCFQITNTSQFFEINDALSSHYCIMNDIDFTGVTPTEIGVGASSFSGSLNGQGYTISNFYSTATNDEWGMISFVNGGEIYDLNIVNITMDGAGLYDRIGAVVGKQEGASVYANITIENANVSAVLRKGGFAGSDTSGATYYNITMINTFVNGTGDQTGGFIGYGRGDYDLIDIQGTVYCTSDCAGLLGSASNIFTADKVKINFSIYPSSDEIGGILGKGSTLGFTINEVATFGQINGTASSFIAYGGIVGFIDCGAKWNCKINNSYSEMDLWRPSESGQRIGGILGRGDDVKVQNTYFAGRIIGGQKNKGGIVGESTSGFWLENYFSDTSISDATTPDTENGGLWGNSAAVITVSLNNYWNNRTDNPECERGGCVDVANVTTIQDNSSYFKGLNVNTSQPMNSWDFNTIWYAKENDYPCLRAIEGCIPPNVAPIVTIITTNQTTADHQPPVSFNVTDVEDNNVSCELLFNGTGYGINSTTLDGVTTTITPNATLVDGYYNVTVECTDSGSEVGSDIIYINITTYAFALDLIFTHANGTANTLFGEAEPFNTYLNYTNTSNGGTPVTSGTCTVDYPNGIDENAAANQNFSLCNNACNYDTYTEAFGSLSTANFVKDEVHLKVCHNSAQNENLEVSLICGSKYTQTIPAGDFGSCGDGYTELFVDFNGNCSGQTSVTVELGNNAVVSESHQIVELEHHRYSNPHTDTLSYNAVTELWDSPHTHNYYIHGTKTITVNCTLPFSAESNQENITIANREPIVSLNSIVVDIPASVTSFTDGVTVNVSSVGTMIFYYTATDDDLNSLTVNISQGTTTIYTYTGLIQNVTRTLVQLPAGTYNFTLFAEDSGSPSLNASITREFTILEVNAPPIIQTYGLNQTSLLFPIYQVNAYCTATDAESDPITYQYNWSINGIDQGVNGLTLNTTGLIAGTDITFTCFVSSTGGNDTASITRTIESSAIFGLYTCPNDTNDSILFGIVIIFAFIMVVLGYSYKAAIFGVIGGFLIILCGLSFLGCSTAMGVGIIGAGFMLVSYFVFTRF